MGFLKRGFPNSWQVEVGSASPVMNRVTMISVSSQFHSQDVFFPQPAPTGFFVTHPSRSMGMLVSTHGVLYSCLRPAQHKGGIE